MGAQNGFNNSLQIQLQSEKQHILHTIPYDYHDTACKKILQCIDVYIFVTSSKETNLDGLSTSCQKQRKILTEENWKIMIKH